MVFHFASRGKGSTSRLVLDDFRALLDEKVRLDSRLCRSSVESVR